MFVVVVVVVVVLQEAERLMAELNMTWEEKLMNTEAIQKERYRPNHNDTLSHLSALSLSLSLSLIPLFTHNPHTTHAHTHTHTHTQRRGAGRDGDSYTGPRGTGGWSHATQEGLQLSIAPFTRTL